MTEARVAEKTPPRFLVLLFRQFGHPRGILGRWALRNMAKANRAVNRWVLDLLDVGSEDVLLDVGCGPGVAMAMASERGARAAGADVSDAAVAAAQRRNPGARVVAAPADRLPFGDGEFTAVMTVNSMGFWPDPEAGMKEIHRVLVPGGRVGVTLRMKVDGVRSTDRRAYGSTPDQIVKVENLLRHLGFIDVARHEGEPGGEATTTVVAGRP